MPILPHANGVALIGLCSIICLFACFGLAKRHPLLSAAMKEAASCPLAAMKFNCLQTLTVIRHDQNDTVVFGLLVLSEKVDSV